MLSSQLNRRVALKRRLETPSDTETTDEKSVPTSTAFLNKKIKPDGNTVPAASPFITSPNVILNSTKVEVSLPAKTTGKIWHTWTTTVNEYDDTIEGFQKLVKDLTLLGVDLDNRINNTDDWINAIQTYTSAGVTIVQIVQAALAGIQNLSGQTYTDVQMALATTLGGLSLIAKFISSQVTVAKTDTVNLKNIVNALEESQKITTPASTPAPAVKIPHADTNLVIDQVSPHALLAPGPFVAVSDLLVVNGPEVEVTLPVRSSGCSKSWKQELQSIKNTEVEFQKLVKTLFSTQVALSNQADNCDEINAWIQSVTSFGTAIISYIQTAIAGSDIDTTGLMITQITIAAFNSVAAFAAKLANNAVTHLRNKTLTYSNNVTELLVAQIRR